MSATLNQVAISNIPDRQGQILRNLLIDRFQISDRSATTAFHLDAQIQASEQNLALRKDSSATRAQLVLNVPFRLIDTTTGRMVLQGRSRSLIPYNVLEERYAGLATLDSAYSRGLNEIAEDITARVAMYLAHGS